MDRQALLKTARADLAHAKADTIQQMTTHYEVPPITTLTKNAGNKRWISFSNGYR